MTEVGHDVPVVEEPRAKPYTGATPRIGKRRGPAPVEHGAGRGLTTEVRCSASRVASAWSGLSDRVSYPTLKASGCRKTPRLANIDVGASVPDDLRQIAILAKRLRVAKKGIAQAL
jgi:hypothetical protein